MTANGEDQVETPTAEAVVGTGSGFGARTFGAAALALVMVLALLDATVETFWGGSPIRWWVGPPVVLFVALVAWLWRPGGALLRRWVVG